MTEIRGTFHAIEHPAGANSPGSFWLMPKGTEIPVACEGAGYALKKGTPLWVSGEFINGRFQIRDLHFDSSDEEAVMKFLSGKRFAGLTKKKATAYLHRIKIAALRRKISYPELTNAELLDLGRECAFPEELCHALSDAIGGIRRREELKEQLAGCGVSPKDIETLFSLYGSEAYGKLRESPYDSAAQGICFQLCDRIAFEEEIDPMGEERLNAFLKKLASYILSSGSCCIRLDEALRYLASLQRGTRYAYLPKAFFLLYLLQSDGFVIKKLKQYGVVVYTKELYQAEQEIGKELKRLTTAAGPTAFTGCEDREGYDADQQKALGFLKTEGVKILTGGPGAGKTTMIRKFIAEYRKCSPKNAPVYLCAPTGRAAVRISESCNEPASTIHKLLGARPFGDSISFQYGRGEQLAVGLCIVDEMSMTDELLFLRLLQALPDHTTLILSGDPEQLPSVQAGTVLRDLVGSGRFEHVHLSGNHRQGKGSSIAENYKRIAEKQTGLITDEDFEIIRTKDETEALRVTMDLFGKNMGNDPAEFQLLSPVRVGELGTIHINSLISADRLSHAGRRDIYGAAGFCVGDKIMMVKNNYAKHYWNGDVGKIIRVEGGVIEAEFYDGLRRIDGESLADMEHAFAATVHKSQGSEYRTVAVVLGKRYPNMLSNALLLTAVTRAKEKVYVITEQDALERAMLTNREAERVTGLCDVLSGLLAPYCQYVPEGSSGSSAACSSPYSSPS